MRSLGFIFKSPEINNVSLVAMIQLNQSKNKSQDSFNTSNSNSNFNRRGNTNNNRPVGGILNERILNKSFFKYIYLFRRPLSWWINFYKQ